LQSTSFAAGRSGKNGLQSGMNETRIRQIFRFSIVLKGLNATAELLGGLLLAVIGTETIRTAIEALTFHELHDDPTDVVATALRNYAEGLSVGAQHFFAVYLLAHGIVKLVLVIGLLRNIMWIYPVAMAALAVFVSYQMYRFTHTHAGGLILLSLFDLFLIMMIWHEYRQFPRVTAG
jgi:uncharacterized membrane protein